MVVLSKGFGRRDDEQSMTAQDIAESPTTTTTIVNYRGRQLRRSTEIGPRGGKRYLWQAADACPVWGFWYQSAAAAAEYSNASDKAVAI